MAVFTPVSRAQLEAWLTRYRLGELRSFEGIASGIENTNYFVNTTAGRFVMTLFERLAHDQLPFYLGMMQHLAKQGIPCPDPIPDVDGQMLGELNGKPAALVTCLAGRSNFHPGPAHCAQVGDLLAGMHLAARDYPGDLPNLRGIAWWRETAPLVAPFLDPADRALLADELAAQEQFHASAAYGALPRSAVHADLFRDNVLFDELDGSPRMGGAIDFYFAGVDTWMFDLAVTVNDWCSDDASGAFDDVRLNALVRAYVARRPPAPEEVRSWPLMLRAGALRFWLSRLFDLHLPRAAEMVNPKDPAQYARILRQRRHGAPPLQG